MPFCEIQSSLDLPFKCLEAKIHSDSAITDDNFYTQPNFSVAVGRFA